MASVAVIDCRPLRDKGNIGATGTAALASPRTGPDAVPQSPTAGQRTPGSARGKGPFYSVQLYGSEVVGRKCSVMQSRSGAKAWEKAQVLDYNSELGQHKLKYNSTKAEEWLFLSDIKFKWSYVQPSTAPANPTYKPEYAGEAGVGKRVRVYWTGMQRWYQGTVKAYDARTDRHTIIYKDGDTQALILKHEPVIWCDDEPHMNGTSCGEQQQQSGQKQQPQQMAVQPAATTPRYSSGPATVQRATAQAGAPAGNASFTLGKFGATGPAIRGRSPRAPMSPRTASAAAAAAVAASFAGTVSRAYKAGPKASAAGKPGAGAGKGPMSSGSTLNHSKGPAAVPGKHAGPGRPPGSSSALGKHGRDAAGSQADSAAKRLKPRPKLGRPPAAAVAGGKVPVVNADKHLLVGCRVGVYWRLDKVFYRGKLVSYSPQSGKFTVKYDDGQSEAILLEKERFVWHCPRGLSAGYRPALHTVMHQLGADGLKPLPQVGEDGRVVAETAGPEGAPHPPVSGPGAVGWRIKLYWAADQAWHEAEVLNHDDKRNQHHLLYLDGEEEWLDLSRETVVWLKATRTGAISAGIVTGDDVPKGRDAVGWRIAVYWKDDKTFYEGEVMDYDSSTGRHKVLYSDGEEEYLALRNERVVWRLTPKDASDEDSDDDGTDVDALCSDIEPVGGKRGLRSRLGGRKRRLLELEHARSDSGSASSGPGRHYAAAGDDSLHNWHSDVGGTGDSLAAGPSAGVQLPQGSYAGGSAATAGDGPHHTLHLSLKRGLGAGSSMKGRGPGPGPSSLGSKAGQGLQHRQGSLAGAAAGFGPGGNVLKGSLGNPNLPPLQLKRFSSSGDGLGSPSEAVQAAEQMQLLVRIVPGGKCGLAAVNQADTAVASAAAAASTPSAAALDPALQHLPVRQQRTATRLLKKVDRLQMILSKLAATAGSRGWKLDPQQMPTTLLTPGLNGTIGPKSPNKLRMNKAGGLGPTSPRSYLHGGPTSPRMNGVSLARASSSTAGTAGPMSPRSAGRSTGPTSPRAAVSPTAAGRTVAVAKTCAVKSKPPALQQQCGTPEVKVTAPNGMVRPPKMCSQLDIPAQPVFADAKAAADADADAAAAVKAAAAVPASADVVAAKPQQAAAVVVRAAQIPSAIMTPAPVLQLQQQLSKPVVLSQAESNQQQQQPTPTAANKEGSSAAVVAAHAAKHASATANGTHTTSSGLAAVKPQTVLTAVVQPPAAAAAPLVAATAAVAPVVAVSKAPVVVPAAAAVSTIASTAAPAAGVVLKAAPTAAAAAAVVKAAAVPTVVAVQVPVVAAAVRPRAPPPALPNVSNPSAPSAHMTADDVVLRLSAMAGLPGNASTALQLQQLQQLAAAQAATAAACTAGDSNSTKSNSPSAAGKKPAAVAVAAAPDAGGSAAKDAEVQPTETD